MRWTGDLYLQTRFYSEPAGSPAKKKIRTPPKGMPGKDRPAPSVPDRSKRRGGLGKTGYRSTGMRYGQPPERVFEKLPPEGEYFVKLPSDESAAEHPSRRTEGEGVMHEVFHRGSSFHLAEVVLVMPEPVRAETLLVHEQPGLQHVRDFRYPADRDAGINPDGVRHDHPRVHARRDAGGDPDSQGGRSDPFEVPGIREEIPCLRNGNREVTQGMDALQVHGRQT